MIIYFLTKVTEKIFPLLVIGPETYSGYFLISDFRSDLSIDFSIIFSIYKYTTILYIHQIKMEKNDFFYLIYTKK